MSLGRAGCYAILGALVLCVGAPFGPRPSLAQAQAPGQFSCRASAVNAFGLEPVVANPPDVPCAPGSEGVPQLALGGLGVGALSAVSGPALGGLHGVHSRAQLAGVSLPVAGLEVTLVQAEATVSCRDGQPSAEGTSQVLGLTLNGDPVDSSAPVDLPLAVGTLHLNHTTVAGAAVTVRAVWLEMGSTSVILGEARASSVGNPCTDGTITIVKEAVPEYPDDFPFDGDLGSFSLRDDPDSPGGNRQTFSRPPGRYRISELPVIGGPVQEAWTVTSIRCTPQARTTARVAERSVEIDLAAGDDVVCTFSNRNEVILAATDGIENPARAGVTRVGSGGAAGTAPATPRAVADLPQETALPPPPSPSVPPRPRTTEGGLLSGSAVALIGVPALALIGGGIWFLLALARRRREEDTTR